MQFRHVVGQQKAKEQLIANVQQERISHAQLFLGNGGSGNLALAIAYAQYVVCENRQAEDSCGVCRACIKVEKLVHPDLHFVYPVATTPNIKSKPVSDNFIELWRNQIIDQPYFTLNQWLEVIGVENKQGIIGTDEAGQILKKLNLKAFESDYKIMIIWMPEKMNDSAANKLLKLIEEPPEKTLFLLVAESSENIINTILSRTQLVTVPRLDRESIQEALQSGFDLSGDALHTAVRIANGSYIKALETVKKSEAAQEYFSTFTGWMRVCYAGKVPEIMAILESMQPWGREKKKNFLTYTMQMVRENLMLTVAPNQAELTYLNGEETDFSNKFHRFINERNVWAINSELELAYKHIARNGSDKIVLLDLSLKLIKLLRS